VERVETFRALKYELLGFRGELGGPLGVCLDIDISREQIRRGEKGLLRLEIKEVVAQREEKESHIRGRKDVLRSRPRF